MFQTYLFYFLILLFYLCFICHSVALWKLLSQKQILVCVNIPGNIAHSDSDSVYTVEMLAILIAVRWVEKTGQDKVLVCSDSSSVLASIRSFYSKIMQDILFEVLQSMTRIYNQGRQIKFLWVPGHVGIRGN